MKAKRKPPAQRRTRGKRGPDRPRFEPASPDDFARVHAGIDRAAAATAAATTAKTPAERKAALGELGLLASGRARDDRELLAAAARVRRDEAIVASWALGLTPPTIGAKFNLSADHVLRIVKAHRERRARTPLPASPELLHDALEALEGQMERCMIIATKKGASESAQVGAIRTWREMFVSRLELLQAMGALTTAPGAEARLARARDLLRGMLDGLRAEGVEQATIDRVAARVLHAGADDNVVTLEGRTQ